MSISKICQTSQTEKKYVPETTCDQTSPSNHSKLTHFIAEILRSNIPAKIKCVYSLGLQCLASYDVSLIWNIFSQKKSVQLVTGKRDCGISTSIRRAPVLERSFGIMGEQLKASPNFLITKTVTIIIFLLI